MSPPSSVGLAVPPTTGGEQPLVDWTEVEKAESSEKKIPVLY
jgi:hypothetical protein